jgi:formylglycine-generating enzyme required for sulfatase activity
MKWMQTWRWFPVTVLLAAGGTTRGQAGDLAIQSFDGTGRLTFNEVSTALTYRVEWAPSPAGPWTNTWQALERIAAYGAGSITCSVPMCYRVVATVTNAATAQPAWMYLVVDLSDGPSAPSYPVTYLDAVPPGGWLDEHKTTKLVLRRIPATTPDFTMGSPSEELGRFPFGTSETQHQVTLTSDFYIGVFEVTQRQWELVMGNKPSYFNNATYYQTRPVEQVSYYEIRENPLPVTNDWTKGSAINPNWPATNTVHADSFMGKLRSKTGLSGFDLPTESQWEYACRAGTATALNSGYNLTNTLSDLRMNEVGRYWHNGGSAYSQGCTPSAGTAQAGNYLANAWGLYDMHGNVWEWCMDWYEAYPGTVTDPPGASSSGLGRVVRCGGWGGSAASNRSAIRINSSPVNRYFDGGFRVCCAPPGQP